eukprot:gene31292-38662_t
MAELRKLENSVREYLISELEIARSRVDSSLDTAAMSRAQIAEDSYTAAELSRETSGGGVIPATILTEEKASSKSIQLLHKKLKFYHGLRNMADSALRDRTRGHIEEVDRLEMVVREYEEELSEKMDECYVLEERATRAENELKVCARRLMKGEIREKLSSEQSWASAIRFASKINELELKMRALKPLLIAEKMAIESQNPQEI